MTFCTQRPGRGAVCTFSVACIGVSIVNIMPWTFTPGVSLLTCFKQIKSNLFLSKPHPLATAEL